MLVNRRAGKEVAHLTYVRLMVKPEVRGWHFVEIADAVKRLVSLFLKRVQPAYLDPSWKKKKSV